MEVRLKRDVEITLPSGTAVSILVLMEVRLKHSATFSYIRFHSCFNPCFNGSETKTCIVLSGYCLRNLVSILVLNGSETKTDVYCFENDLFVLFQSLF